MRKSPRSFGVIIIITIHYIVLSVDQTMQYVRSLEQRVKQLEDEKRSLQHKLKSTGINTDLDPSSTSSAVLSGRPEAVVRALQVLEVREQLERDGRDGRSLPERVPVNEGPVEDPAPDMDDGEKALVLEMCNVSIVQFIISLVRLINIAIN